MITLGMLVSLPHSDPSPPKPRSNIFSRIDEHPMQNHGIVLFSPLHTLHFPGSIHLSLNLSIFAHQIHRPYHLPASQEVTRGEPVSPRAQSMFKPHDLVLYPHMGFAITSVSPCRRPQWRRRGNLQARETYQREQSPIKT